MADDDDKTGDESGEGGDGGESTEGKESTSTGGSSGEGSATGDTSSDDDKSGKDDQDSELAEARRKLAEANKEARKYRHERNDARKALEEREAAELSDLEKEKKRADDAEAKFGATMTTIQDANLKVALAESEHPIVDIETASMLLRNRGIEFDDDGKPQDVSEAIDGLVEDKAFLVGSGTRRAGGSSNAGSDDTGNGGPALSADEMQIAKSFGMTAEEYSEYKDRK